jgi:hypothetical protein
VARDGEVDPLFSRAYGLDRIEAIRAGQDVQVAGWEVTGSITEAFDRDAYYTLTVKNRLVPS